MLSDPLVNLGQPLVFLGDEVGFRHIDEIYAGLGGDDVGQLELNQIYFGGIPLARSHWCV